MATFSNAINSSSIRAVSYCVEDRHLTVTFRSDRVYLYFGVDYQTYNELIGSESPGTYFNLTIRPHFECVELTQDEDYVCPNQHIFRSSFLQSASYDDISNTAYVTMNGRTYEYRLCQEAWTAFIESQSPGAYFNNFIRESTV